MSNYQDQFTLDINDIDIIEQALRTQAALESRINGEGDAEFIRATAPKAKQIHDLLGKIHNQKKFYASVHSGFCPVG